MTVFKMAPRSSLIFMKTITRLQRGSHRKMTWPCSFQSSLPRWCAHCQRTNSELYWRISQSSGNREVTSSMKTKWYVAKLVMQCRVGDEDAGPWKIDEQVHVLRAADNETA